MELLSDSMGRREFMTYLEKEFSGKDTEMLDYILDAVLFHNQHVQWQNIPQHFHVLVCAPNLDGYRVRFVMVKK